MACRALLAGYHRYMSVNEYALCLVYIYIYIYIYIYMHLCEFKEYTERATSVMIGNRGYTILRLEGNLILYWCVYVCLISLVHFIHHDTQIIMAIYPDLCYRLFHLCWNDRDSIGTQYWYKNIMKHEWYYIVSSSNDVISSYTSSREYRG